MACTPGIKCGTDIDLETLLKSLIVKGPDGCYYLNTLLTLNDCEDLSSGVDCTANQSGEELFRKTIVLDTCDRPAINITMYSPT